MSASENLSRVKDIEASAIRGRDEILDIWKVLTPIQTFMAQSGLYIDNDGDISQY